MEFACRLFDAERLGLVLGARVAGLSRTESEAELRARRIPIHRPMASVPVRTPRLADRQQARDFRKQAVEIPADAGL